MSAAMLTLHSACAVLVGVALISMVQTGLGMCWKQAPAQGNSAFLCWLCLMLECWEPAAGPVDFRHAFIDMSRVEVRASNYTQAGRTCPAAMGFSFAAGTTDGEQAGTTPHTPLQMLKDIGLCNHLCARL